MIATTIDRPPRSATLLPLALLAVFAFAGCKPAAHEDRPSAPETAAPAPPAAVSPGEDRGRKQGEAPAASPEADQSAFSNVESGETERAASKRGHDSAGEPTPASQPGSGG